MGTLDRAEDERLVLALRAGDQDAFGRLFDRWYDRVHELARRITRDDGLAADVAQDAFLAAWQRLPRLEDPASFGGWLLRIARNRALDVVRAPAHARTAVDDDVHLTVDEQAVTARLTAVADPGDVTGDREVQDLVWSAAATLGERDLTALDLSLRHGMEPAEIGEVLGINRNAANQLVHRMRGRLTIALRSRVLWRGGRPECPTLQQALAADGLDEFDARAVRVADRHATGCEACTRRQDTRLDPAQLFAAVPIAVAPVLLKAKAAAALEAAGVPVGGASGAGPVDGSGSGSGEGSGPGSGSGSDGPAASASASTPSSARRRRSRTRRALALGAVGVVVVATVVAVVAVERLDHDDPVVIAEGAPVTVPDRLAPSPTPTTTTEGHISIVITPDEPVEDPEAAPADPEDPAVQPDSGSGPSAPPPPPPPPAAPTGSLSISPSTVPTVHPVSQRATVSWSTGGGTSVSVSGPGLTSGGASGAQSVCPGAVVGSPSVCRTAAGTYTYVLTVSGPGGTTQRTASLTVS